MAGEFSKGNPPIIPDFIQSISDTVEIDLDVTANDLSASIVAGSIDESKLDTSVNASLNLADSALQSFTETDPMFTASQAFNIDAGDIINLGNLSGTNTGDQDLSHTGEVTGTTQALTLNKTAISNRTDVTITASDTIIYGDATDTNNLKKDTVQGILDLVPATTPAGSDGDLQINNSGVFGTIDGLNLDKTGNARGTNALDFQSNRSASTQVASGTSAVCIGSLNTSSGDRAIAIGASNISSFYNSIVIGSHSTASNGFAIAIGLECEAAGYGATSCGYESSASGYYSLAIGGKSGFYGQGNTASGNYSAAVGIGNTATNFDSTAFGTNNTSSGYYSTAIGANNLAASDSSFAGGSYCSATADSAIAIGLSITNSTAYSVEIGSGNTSKIRVSLAGVNLLTLPLLPATLSNASAPNNSVYYSSTNAKLVYKDGSGTVNNLY